MKTLTLNGIPYTTNEKHELFVYSSNPPISIGSFDPSTQKVTLVENWKEKSNVFLNEYRQSLLQNTHEALEKANALQNS